MAINESVNLPVRAPGVGAASAKFTALGGSIKGASLQLKTLAAGLIAGFGIKQATDIIEGFEKQMAAVRGISGATEEQFQRLTDTARELGATTIFSARQAAEGLTELSKLGFTAEESIASLSTVLTLAQAGMLELGQSAAIVGASVRSFGVDASRSGDIADIFAKAATSSALTVEGLGQALSFAGATAASFGISLQEATAAIAVQADAGVRASRAGRGLTTLYSELARETEKVEARAKQYGLTARDLNPIHVGQAQALENLAKVYAVAGSAQQDFGAVSARALTLITGNIERYKELVNILNNSRGAAIEFARIMGDTLFGAFKSLRSAVEEFNLQIGDRGLKSALTDVTKLLAGALNAINGTAQAFAENTKLTEEQIRSFTQLARILSVIIGVVETVFNVFSALAKVIRIVQTNLIALGVAYANVFKSIASGDFSQLQKSADVVAQVFRDSIKDVDEIRKSFTGLQRIISGFDFSEDSLFSIIEKGTLKAKEQADAFLDTVKNIPPVVKELNNATAPTNNVIPIEQLREAQLLERDLASLTKELGAFDKQLEKIGESKFVDDIKDQFDSAKDAVSNYQDAQKRLIESIKTYVEALKDSNLTDEKKEELLHQIALNEKDVALLREVAVDQIREVTDSTRELGQAERERARDAKNLAREQRQAQRQAIREAKEFADNVKRSFDAALDVASSIVDAYQEIQDSAREARNAQLAVPEAEGNLERVQSRIAQLEGFRDDPRISDEARADYDRQITELEREQLSAQHDVRGAVINAANAEEYHLKNIHAVLAGSILNTLQTIGSLFASFSGSNARIPTAHSGGIVGGSPGSESLIRARAGEAILTPAQFNNLANRGGSGGSKPSIRIVDQRTTESVPAQISQNRRTGDIEIILRKYLQDAVRNGALDYQIQDRYNISSRGL